MLNKAILVGRLTKDPELKSTGSGVSVLNFTVAITRKYKDANGERQSDFVNCVAFRQTAEFISNYFKKGNMISIDGTIQTRTWDDNEGKRHYVTEVLVNDAGFIESKREMETGGATKKAADSEELPEMPAEFDAGAVDDDLPF